MIEHKNLGHNTQYHSAEQNPAKVMNGQTKVNKNRQIVILTVFAMLLVVLGHSDITEEFRGTWIVRWVYSFHMPLFFFISGFLFSLTMPTDKFRKTKFSTFIKKKCIRLLVPFLFINTIIFIVKSTLISDSSMMKNPVGLNFPDFLDSTLFHPLGFMWFLPTLFCIFLIAFPLTKIIKVNTNEGWRSVALIGITMIAALGIYYYLPPIEFMQFSKCCYYLFYFLLGILYCDYKESVDHFIRRYWLFIGLIFLGLSVSLMLPEVLAALCGIIFSVTFALILEDKCSDRLVEFSAMTYAIFLLSYFPQMLIRGPIAHKFSQINEYILSTVSFISGIIVPVAVCIIYFTIRNRSKSRLIKKSGVLIGL